MPRWCGAQQGATMGETETGKSMVVWFEIPAREFERTVGFYETLFATTLRQEQFGGPRMAVFPYERPGVGGAVIEAGALTPGGCGTLVYLNCDGRLEEVIGRVEPAGGKLAGPKVRLPPGMGSFVHVLDPEGNRIGLHGI
jgi:predicted enzyme related to lactoylglutathione lyase